jgi:hypothetical protein
LASLFGFWQDESKLQQLIIQLCALGPALRRAVSQNFTFAASGALDRRRKVAYKANSRLFF